MYTLIIPLGVDKPKLVAFLPVIGCAIDGIIEAYI